MHKHRRNKNIYKNFFDTLYEKTKNQTEFLIKIPVIEGNEPMWEEGTVPNAENWVTWRRLPAQVSDEEIAKLEKKIGAKLPQV